MGFSDEDALKVLSSVNEDDLEFMEGLCKLSDFGRAVTQPVDPAEMRVGLDKLPNGLEVSTTLTNDCGYETAIIDAEEIIPVERYPDLEAAQAGHKKWVEEMAKSPKTIQKLPWCAIVPDTGGERTLVYPEEKSDV
jgi:hypothetical protein